jgi:hypothetical protein
MFPFEVFRSGAAAANLLQRPSHEFTPLIPEPVVFRKLIGTLRNNRGIFVHETMLSLLVAGRQQGCNPYEEFKRIARNNETISRDQAVPAVAPLG